MEAKMEDLKVERSALKKKITMLSKQMEKAVQRKTATEQLTVIDEEMKSTFQKFVKVDEEYNAMLEKDAKLKEKYSVVNGLDTEQYTESVRGNARRRRNLQKGRLWQE